MVLGRCHTSDLKFRIWFVLISEIARQQTFFAKRLNCGNQIDAHVGSAKYSFLIKGLLIEIALR